ncbi:hypothetical protein BDD12DRAFT_883129 [Trichophaea hybrida]|nr:hypothetical protein BDD12DRAFT_883129 [Trichophaea hybrida]
MNEILSVKGVIFGETESEMIWMEQMLTDLASRLLRRRPSFPSVSVQPQKDGAVSVLLSDGRILAVRPRLEQSQTDGTVANTASTSSSSTADPLQTFADQLRLTHGYARSVHLAEYIKTVNAHWTQLRFTHGYAQSIRLAKYIKTVPACWGMSIIDSRLAALLHQQKQIVVD